MMIFHSTGTMPIYLFLKMVV